MPELTIEHFDAVFLAALRAERDENEIGAELLHELAEIIREELEELNEW